MAKGKQRKGLKVNIAFTPVQDWDTRLRRVLGMLLQISEQNQKTAMDKTNDQE